MMQVEQVGGDHYASEYQHWDWILDIGMTYIPATATKYLPRWRKKNGIADLEKSLSYIDKAIVEWDKVFSASVEPPENIDELNARFVKSNGMENTVEAQICYLLSDLSVSDMDYKLHQARELLIDLIAKELGRAGAL